jgi:hypothetical protein
LAISAARIEPTRLGLWSFGAAIAHGAGLMRAPIYLGLCQTDGLQRGDAAASTLLGANFGMAVLVSIVRSGAMIASGGLSAWLVYRYLRAAPEGPEFPVTPATPEAPCRDASSVNRASAAARPSWRNTTMRDTTRAWPISRRPTSTSDGLRPSSSNAKGSNDRQSQTVACSTNCMPHNLNRK